MTGRALLWASAAVLLPSLVPLSLAFAVEPGHEVRFNPPVESLIISRTVIRELSDGKQIKVVRRYAAQFETEAQGFRLNGKLIDVVVDVPPMLSGLAEIERRRNDGGMFPVYINSTGAILAKSSESMVDQDARTRMAAQATSMLAVSQMPQENLQLASQFTSHLMQTHPGSQWPVDLFQVRPGEHRQSRVVSLPGGTEGRIEVVTRVNSLLPCGLPRTIDRTVITQTAGTKRVSHEIWSFHQNSPSA